MSYSTPPIYSPNDIPNICITYSLTPQEVTVLSTKSSAAKATAYCPYSRFHVGATLLTSEGQYISGANVENASYPVGTCAERVALGKAVTDLGASVPGGGGFKEWTEGKNGVKRKFKALAVATDISPPASPCGMCRQFIREFCDIDMPILMFDKDANFQILTMEQLLPLSFGPEHLPPPV